MATLIGLHRRGGIYHLRIVVPKDLRARFGRSYFRKSLGTADRSQAELLGTIERARLLALFNTAKQSSDELPKLSEQAQRVLAPLQGITLPSGLETPSSAAQAAPPPRPKTLTLRQLYEQRWKPSKQRTKGSEHACLLAVECCEKALGALPIDQLTRQHGDSFRTWLLQQPISSKTARDRFTWVKTLLGYAHRELELIPKQPWQGMEIQVSKTQARRPWEDSELQQLFSQPLFTTYAIPPEKKSGRDAAYWVPLIALYSGARIGELAQLRTEDITTVGGVPLLRITNSGDGQRVKTEASNRSIPIHSELLRLGLLEYVQAIKDAGHDRLWPMLKADADRPGLILSNWFGQYRRSIGLTEKYPDFHSFRHLVRTRMSRAKIPDKVQDTITGHETQGSIGTKVYQSVSLEDRIEAIESLSYPFLHLPKTYTAPCLEKAQREGWKACVESRRKRQGSTDAFHIVGKGRKQQKAKNPMTKTTAAAGTEHH